MSLSTIIFILAVFIIFSIIPVPWYIALALMFALYYVSPWCIQKIQYVLWKLNIKR